MDSHNGSSDYFLENICKRTPPFLTVKPTEVKYALDSLDEIIRQLTLNNIHKCSSENTGTISKEPIDIVEDKELERNDLISSNNDFIKKLTEKPEESTVGSIKNDVDDVSTQNDAKNANKNGHVSESHCILEKENHPKSPDRINGNTTQLNKTTSLENLNELLSAFNEKLDSCFSSSHKNDTQHINNCTTTSSTKICAKCQKQIKSKFIEALDCFWHVNHFACFKCSVSLNDMNYFIHNKQPYCKKCFDILLAPTCCHCNNKIITNCLTFDGNTWHFDHFTCTVCGCLLINQMDSVKLYQKKPYCIKDYNISVLKQCLKCNQTTLNQPSFMINNYFYHQKCLICSDCNILFERPELLQELDGNLYCKTHFKSRSGSTCSLCFQSVIGALVRAGGRIYHPEHFICKFCYTKLKGKSYFEHSGYHYCVSCHEKLNGK